MTVFAHLRTIEDDALRELIEIQQRKINRLNSEHPPGVRSEWVEDDISFETVWRDRYQEELNRRKSST
jgi:hypothetical protein